MINYKSLQNALIHNAMEYKETATYVSSTSFDITGDVTSLLRPGLAFELSDAGTRKYGYITAVALNSGNTRCTVLTNTTAGAISTLSGGAITNVYIGSISGMRDHIGMISYQPTYTGSGSLTYTSVTTHLAGFWVIGNICTCIYRTVGTTGGTASTQIRISLPIDAKLNGANRIYTNSVYISDGTVDAGHIQINNALLTDAICLTRTAGNWSLGTNREVRGTISYPIDVA